MEISQTTVIKSIDLPPDVEAVFREFRTCEFTTITREGIPVTWPTSARYQPESGRFLITSTIGFPQKVFHIRRNPHVSLLFSNPTGSGLASPPSVLVQGDATAPDNVVTSVKGLEDYWRDTIFRRQPASEMPDNAIMHKFIDWYYMRILIWVTPRTIRWWPAGDFTRPMNVLEVSHVG